MLYDPRDLTQELADQGVGCIWTRMNAATRYIGSFCRGKLYRLSAQDLYYLKDQRISES
jgi:hypothetical protein